MDKEYYFKDQHGRVTHVITKDDGVTRVYKAIDNTDNPLVALIAGPVQKGTKVAEIRESK